MTIMIFYRILPLGLLLTQPRRLPLLVTVSVRLVLGVEKVDTWGRLILGLTFKDVSRPRKTLPLYCR